MARLSWQEQWDLAKRLANGEVNADDVSGAPDLDEDDRDRVFNYGLHFVSERLSKERKAKLGKGQRRALGLLRTFLTPEQRRQLRVARAFVVETEPGVGYRLIPGMGTVQRVYRHGRRWFYAGRYCLHEDKQNFEGILLDLIPPADRTIGHLLLLLADEERFLSEANFTPSLLWNGDWLRRLVQARRERQAHAA